MRIAINALPIRWGGGLTVVHGLASSLREIAPGCEISIVTSDARAYERLVQLDAPTRVDRILPNAGPARLVWWQKMHLGGWLKYNNAQLLLCINHFLPRIACPQVVYHLNLLRFLKFGPQRGLVSKLKESLRDYSARQALFCADANVFESEFLRSAASRTIGGEIRNSHVIYAGLPGDLLQLSAQRQQQDSHDYRIVAITSPNPHKDNNTLISTLAELVKRDPDLPWNLDVLGGATERAWIPLQAYAQEMGIAERIRWHGYCDQERMTEVFAGALCLVSTSLVESFAMVAVEAMARGCPPIVANCASMPESVGDAGLLATPGSKESFADAVLALATQRELRAELVRKGHKWVPKFTWSNCGREFHSLFQELLSERGHSGRNSASRRAAA